MKQVLGYGKASYENRLRLNCPLLICLYSPNLIALNLFTISVLAMALKPPTSSFTEIISCKAHMWCLQVRMLARLISFFHTLHKTQLPSTGSGPQHLNHSQMQFCLQHSAQS